MTATPVPRDPGLAYLAGPPYSRPNQDFAYFHTATILGPDTNKGHKEKDQEIGYTVHPHCWLLVDRVIGQILVEANLKTFVKAILQFWEQNYKWWWLTPSPKEICFKHEGSKCLHGYHPWGKTAPTGRNPMLILEIRDLIQKARARKTSSRRDKDPPQPHRQKRQQQLILFHIPLEISIMIIETIDYDHHSKDAENILTAFGWRLPDTY